MQANLSIHLHVRDDLHMIHIYFGEAELYMFPRVCADITCTIRVTNLKEGLTVLLEL